MATDSGRDNVKVVKLYGWRDETVYEREDPETLPADVMNINFAIMKLSQSTTEWLENKRTSAIPSRSRQNSTEQDDVQASGGSSRLSKEEVVSCVVESLLKDHCLSDVGLEQAGKLLCDPDIRKLDIATDVVRGTEPSKWPAKALAQQVLKVLESLLLIYGSAEEQSQDVSRSSTFKDDFEVRAQVGKIIFTCDSLLCSKILDTLETYFLTESTAASATDFKEASRLLAFCDAGDTDTMALIIAALGKPRMPFAAISQSVSSLVSEHGPNVWREVEESLRRRYNLRSTPSLFPSSRQRRFNTATAPSSRSSSPIRPRRASTPPASIVGYHNDYDMEEIPPSASAPSSPKRSRFTSPLPQPKQNSVVIRIQRSSGGDLSSRRSIKDVVFAYNHSEERLGKTSEKFKWWNIILDHFKSVKDLDLIGTPAPGDVITYWDKSREEAGAYAYLENGWTNISHDYYSNTGKVLHPNYPPSEPRILSWKSSDDLAPTWVVKNTFMGKRKYAHDLILTLDDYKRTLTSATNPIRSFNVGAGQ